VYSLNQTNDALWLVFEALAKRYPHDGDVRLTADMARWLLRERQRAGLPAPSILEQVMHAVKQELDALLLLEKAVARKWDTEQNADSLR
jgi:hypothetical protein